MSFDAVRWAFDEADTSGLSPAARQLLVVLAYRMNDRTGRLDPTVRRLCDDSGRRRDSVLGALAELESAGLLCVERAPGQRHRYRLTPVGKTDGLPVGKTDYYPSEKPTGPVGKTDGHPNLEGNKEVNPTAKGAVMATDYTPEMIERMGRGESPFSKSSQAGRKEKPRTFLKSRTAPVRAAPAPRAAAPRRRAVSEILDGALLAWWRTELLPLYPCERPSAAAEVIAGLAPGPALRGAIVADVRARAGSRKWIDGFRPSLENYLHERTWEDPFAAPAVRDPEEDMPAGATNFIRAGVA